MGRMIHRLCLVGSALTLLVLLRSYIGIVDGVNLDFGRHRFSISSFNAEVFVEWSSNWRDRWAFAFDFAHNAGGWAYADRFMFFIDRTQTPLSGPTIDRAVAFPHWAILILLMAYPVARFTWRWRSRRLPPQHGFPVRTLPA